MHDPAATLSTISLLVIWTALSVLAGWRLLARVPWEPRRPVPWNGLDLLLVLGAFELLLGTVVFAAQWGLGIKVGMDPAAAGGTSRVSPDGNAGPVRLGGDPSAKEATPMNPLLVALVRRHQPGTLLLCCFAAIVAAPLAEEFFFRLLLQGWLESVEGRWRKQFRPLRRLWPGLLPVLLVSALFGAAHFRLAKEPGNVDALLAQYVLIGVAEVLTVAFAVGYIRFRTGATAADLGFIREKLPRDLALGLAAVVLCVPLLFSVQWVAASILPKKDAADPVTLFFFAAVMGIIYFRTHRIVPSIVMHVAFNALNLAAAWYLLK